MRLAVAGAIALACSGSPAGAPDAGTPDAAPAIATPAPPAPPASPVLTPCPAGWREVVGDDVVTCDPWPEGGALACADDEAHFPGEPGCARIGSACPADGWPAGLPAGKPVLWVRAGSAPGGTGTKASPFATIYAAASAAAPGTVIAVATGLYEEGFVLDGTGLILHGACVAGTRVAASVPSETSATIHVTATGVEIRNLSLGGARLGLRVFPAASAHVEDVVIAGAQTIAVHVQAGTLTARNLAVRDTSSRPSDSTLGRGLETMAGAHIELERAVFERNRDLAIGVYEPGTELLLADAAVRDTQSRQSTLRSGSGLNVALGARVEIARASFERNRMVNIAVEGAGSTVVLSDVVVTGTLAQESDGRYGLGLGVRAGAQVEATRALFERNRDVAVNTGDPGTEVVLSDVVVRDTLSAASDGRSGSGLGAQTGARLEVARARLTRNRDVAIFATGEGTTVALSDLVVTDTLSQENDSTSGGALAALFGAQIDVARASFERNRGVTLLADGDAAVLVLSDVAVRDTLSQEVDGRYGRGLSVQRGARVGAERALFERNRDVAIFVSNAGTTATLADVAVLDTFDQECRDSGTCGWSITSHIGSYDGAAVDVRRFQLLRSAFLGLQIAPVPPAFGGMNLAASIDLAEGVVAENPIGINIQSDGFDLGRIRDRVVWGPNQVNLVSDALPVPGAGGP